MKYILINSKSKSVIQSNKEIYKKKLMEHSTHVPNFRANDFTDGPG